MDARAPYGLSGSEYDAQWNVLGDFIRYNPGARHRRRLSVHLLQGLSGREILDVGCGRGEMLLTLRQCLPDAARIVGADIAADTVQDNGMRLPWAEFAVLDIVDGRLDAEFDLVTCCEVLEHVADRPRAFANLAAMVRPGGWLLVTCPTGRIYETERRFGHVSHPDDDELDTLGRASGFETLRSLNWGWPIYKTMKWATNVDPDWAMEKFGSGQYSPASRAFNHLLYAANYFNFSTRRGCQLFRLYRRPL